MKDKITNEGDNLWVMRVSGLLKKSEVDAAQKYLWSQVSPGTKVRQLVLLTNFAGWEKSEAWNDMSNLENHGDDFERIAVVGDSKWETEGLMFLGAGLRKTDIRFFPPEGENAARAWLKS
jgi:hypothetical protein